MAAEPRTYNLRELPAGGRCDTTLQNLLETAWTERHDAGVGFRYRLNVEQERIADGAFGFVLQLNRSRLTERRQPQTFQLNTPFDPSRFHFNRVDPAEVLLEIDSPTPTTLLINNSPVTPFHSLVVPDRNGRWPQLITPDGIRIALELLLRLPDRRYRVGYNSSGAMASVNHLHLHLLRIDRDLFVQHTPLVPIRGASHIYRLPEDSPARGYCFIVRDPTHELGPVCSALSGMIELLVRHRMAHNLFFTWAHIEPGPVAASEIRILVYPRTREFVNKAACSFNTAFLELSGFVSVGDIGDFERLTEGAIVQALREAQGDVYAALRDVLPDSGELSFGAGCQ